MILAVASGKGGTGKTTVAVNLALARDRPPEFLDCDVEEPNAHLLLHPVCTSTTPVRIPVPEFEAAKCTGCGRCTEVCAYNALALLDRQVLVFENLCHGCGGCVYFCPEGALREGRREIGVIERGRAGNMSFARGSLYPGEALAPPIISALRRGLSPGKDAVLDCPPGTSCPVIQAVRGVDYCLAVTEPTPFGRHDLEALVEVLKVLGVPHGVVINRADLGDDGVEEFCRRRDITVLGRMPFDPEVARCFSEGKPIVRKSKVWKQVFDRLWNRIEAETGGAVARA